LTSAAARPSPSKGRSPDGYSARHLQVLEGLEAVRKRPGMYIGSTDSKGLTHLAYEIVDNCVDEALAGHCDRIEVTLHPDGSIQVEDDGRGIPVDVEPRSGLTGVELVLTKLHAGGKFGGGGYKTSGGLHGVGASVVNALSVRLDVVVRRAGRVHTMSFSRGVPGVFATDGPAAAFSPRDGLSVAGKAPRGSTGTSVRWWPDLALFSKGSAVDVEQLRDRLRQTAFLVPGLALAVLDRRSGELVEETFRFDGGTADFVEHLAPDRPLSDPIHITGSGNYKETVPVLDDTGHMTTQTVERHCEVDVALRWGTGYDTVTQSFCNVVRTGHGGSHQNGFERAVLKTLNETMKATRVLRANDDPVVKDDVLEGLTAVVTVKVPEPQYLGQTKDELGTPGVSKIVADVVARGLKTEFLDNRKTKAQARQVLEKVAAAAKTRLAARASKDAARRKTALESSTLPAKLADCRSTDVSRTELWLVEGDSALGTGKLARNSEFQALLPLRGKILNVQKAGVSEMLSNAECAAIIQVIGAGTGRTFDLEQMRYGKVVLMSVHPDDSVLVADRAGRFRLTSIGSYVDDRLDVQDHVPEASTVSYDGARSLRASPLKRVIRHDYTGQMLTLSTSYGRSVRVTAGHSVFAWRDGRAVLLPSDQLVSGDKLVAPRRLPRPHAAVLELDLLELARQVDPKRYRVHGEGVSRLRQQLRHEAGPTDAVDRSVQRVRLGARAQQALVEARTSAGLTHAEPNGSRNDRYRALGEHAWVRELPASHDAVVGRDARLYARAHPEQAFSRFRAVDEDLCEFLGWYLAEGTLSQGAVRLHLGESDRPYLPRLSAIVERLFGAALTLRSGSGEQINACFSSAEATLIVKALGLHVDARHKRIPDLLLNVDESCQLAFLAGYYLGDGTKGAQDAKLTFTTASRSGADGLGYLLGQLGILASISEHPSVEGRLQDGRAVHSRAHWSINICGRDQLRRLRRVWRDGVNADAVRANLSKPGWSDVRAEKISDDLVALPITHIDSEPWDGPVYDFSVADDESFVAGFGGGVCAHNTDADVDGSHIRCLLITLFARYMRPVIEEGRLFSAVPPLHRIEVSGSSEPIYTYTDKQLQAELKKLERASKKVKGQIQRYKGLGEMDPDQLAETTMHPASRVLRRIQPGEVEAAERVLELLMGNDVAPRRDFIVHNASRVDRGALDT
jgi:DNA gyrase subunit B